MARSLYGKTVINAPQCQFEGLSVGPTYNAEIMLTLGAAVVSD